MKIEEYLKSLPENIVSGEDVQLPNKSFREIFNFLNLGKKDIFYHLGCGNGKGIALALKEYNVKKAVGIDNNPDKIKQAKDILIQDNLSGELICVDIQNV
ncbi:MAG: class I SAM-dependent methyltransferase, partial [Nitrosarchaeum sp.]